MVSAVTACSGFASFRCSAAPSQLLARDERCVRLERVAAAAGHAQRFDQAEVRLFIEWQRRGPSLCPRGGAGPVARKLRVADELPHRRAELCVERDALVLDPAPKPVAADVLRALEEVATPTSPGFLNATGGHVALERHDVELHGIVVEPNRVAVDVDAVAESLLELQERLSEGLPRAILPTLTPEEGGELRARDGARRSSREIAQERERFAAKGTSIAIASLAQPSQCSYVQHGRFGKNSRTNVSDVVVSASGMAATHARP